MNSGGIWRYLAPCVLVATKFLAPIAFPLQRLTVGNSYRLVVAVDFEKGIVWIKWLGAHRDYGRIDVKQVKYEK